MRPIRLVVQDTALSRREQGFEPPMGRHFFDIAPLLMYQIRIGHSSRNQTPQWRLFSACLAEFAFRALRSSCQVFPVAFSDKNKQFSS